MDPSRKSTGPGSILNISAKKKQGKVKHVKQMSHVPQAKQHAQNAVSPGQFQIYTSAASVQDLKLRAKKNQNMMQVYAGDASVVL